jgi:endonuclease/exonuclease/phosphatase family metal-dependent hydrolase
MSSVVGLQEVFANKYYNTLTDPQTVSYAYVTAKDMRGDFDVGDGLTLLSDFQLENLVRTQWGRCNGTINEDGSDCDAPKGFTFTEVTLEPNVTFHLYTLHADSGQGLEDQDVRRANIDQLIAAINANSPEGTAVIVLGDTNSLYTRVGTDNIQDLLTDTGVQDVWVELRRSGIVPGAGPEIDEDCETTPSTGNCEEVDKIFYRDGATLAFVPQTYQVLRSMFMGTITPLSDHDPVAVEFEYTAVTSPTTTTLPTSTTTTTMIGDRPCGDPIADSAAVAADDALFVLKSAVGTFPCPLCTCDVNGNASVSAADSLIALKFAVGQNVTLDCPPCEGATTTTTTTTSTTTTTTIP